MIWISTDTRILITRMLDMDRILDMDLDIIDYLYLRILRLGLRILRVAMDYL